MPAPQRLFDPLFPAAAADAIWHLCERFGRYGMYSEEGTADDGGSGLPQRFDAAFNFVKTGGRFAREEPLATLAARTNYFRETYAYGEELHAPEIARFHRYEGFLEAAREIHGRALVRPAISYANLLLPGQELAVHTDVPEFRGMSRLNTPQWLLVVMHHSGLFERWRMPIATAVAYFGSCRGGAFVFYPDGRDGAPRTLPARHNTAVMLDTDSVFHGVDRVEEEAAPLPALRPGMQLVREGADCWRAGPPGGEPLARYRDDQLRFSVSWKAYCFADAAEERAVREHTDDVTRDQAFETLLGDLRRRGRLPQAAAEPRDLALRLVDEYVKFPPARAEAA